MTAQRTTPEGKGRLTAQERRLLLSLARASLQAAVAGGPRPRAPEAISPTLEEHRGAFVTLTIAGDLRGCIGYIKGVKPVWQAVIDMAVQAGLHDPRFPPVDEDELEQLAIEISVLTPLELVTDVKTITVGVHGLLIQKGWASGLLLPQVATEYGWDREEFLDQTCVKAGLPPGAWRQDAKIYAFSAEIFSEEGERMGQRAT